MIFHGSKRSLLAQVGVALVLLALAILVGRIWSGASVAAIVVALVISALVPVLWPAGKEDPPSATGSSAPPKRLVAPQLPGQATAGRSGSRLLVFGVVDANDVAFLNAARALSDLRIIEPGAVEQLPLTEIQANVGQLEPEVLPPEPRPRPVINEPTD